jgi:phage terminase large subunit
MSLSAPIPLRPKDRSTKDFLPAKLRDLFFRAGPGNKPVYIPSRYKVAYGGRASGKSWGLASIAIVLGAETKLRILCVREYQSSLKESVHELLHDRIDDLGLSRFYHVIQTGIYGTNGTEVLFTGIKTDPGRIKSTEGIDICLVEEAERVSEGSWRILIPTIRKAGSEIWVSFNPNDQEDATYVRFVKNKPPDARTCFINWNDNPFFSRASELERAYSYSLIERAANDDDRAQAQMDYDHVWGGLTRNNSAASVFRRRVVVHDFPEPPDGTRLYYGADWGFANDPSALIRMWITTNPDRSEELWISHEAYGFQTELDDLPALFDTVPGARKWPIKGDSARPETISHMAKKFGFHITAAEKWPGSLEDGIAHVKAYYRIHIHSRCKHIQQEARLYSYKVDKNNNNVILPIVIDAWNHGWDAVRYGLDGVIKRKRSFFG